MTVYDVKSVTGWCISLNFGALVNIFKFSKINRVIFFLLFKI